MNEKILVSYKAPVLRNKIHKGNQMENDLSGQK